jgi:5-methylthioribose kinase
LLEPTDDVVITTLAGGVSGDVVAVRGDTVQLVVKTPLAQLKVAHEWRADRRRVIAEAAALQIAARVTPGLVPRVVDIDEESCVLVLEASQPAWVPLRDQLLLGICEPETGALLGSSLAEWHTATQARELLPPELQDLDAFVKLRIDPFYRFVAAQYPDLASQIEAAAEALLTERSCLVHGDLSPKNILVGAEGIWVLDWEVAHFGSPAFDLSFMLTHLILKTVHCPQFASAYEEFADTFLGSYRESVASFNPPERQVALNVACLLLARVDGKSPAPYLTEDEANRTRLLSIDLIIDPPATALEVWDRL